MIRLIRISLWVAAAVVLGYFVVAPSLNESVDIGGEFTLTNTAGETVTNDSLKGQKRLVVFGFTYCPDICPTALQTLQVVREELQDKAPPAYFITIDPARDTPQHLAGYMQNFPAIIGLTGTAEQVAQAAKSYRVFYRKAENKQNPESYMMDHSSLIYLMDENGNYLTHFPHSISPQEMVKKMQPYL